MGLDYRTGPVFVRDREEATSIARLTGHYPRTHNPAGFGVPGGVMKRIMQELVGAAIIIAGATLIACGGGSPSSPSSPYQVGATGNFRGIQDAVNAAPAGEVVEVMPGTYAERVVVNKSLKLRATRAVLDGSSLNGGIGILVSGTSNVEVSGFTVQNFERGIVFQNATNSSMTSNEVRNNRTRSAPPFTFGVTPWEGIVLIASKGNDILDNFSHDNGHDGLMVTDGSSDNRIRNNRFTDNGAQTPTSVG
jgi:parallel beta-helix repeat protein